MNKLIVKVLGTPIGGVSRVDGDGDGFVTGPSGKDNIPAIPKAVKKLVRALKEKVISDKKTPRSKNSIEQREVSLSFNDAKGRKVTARVVSTIDYTNPDVPPRKDVSIWIADENGKNIGALFAKKGYPDPQGLNDLNDMNISDVTVDEDRQRSGLATAMMELASKYNVDGEEVKHSRRLSPQGKLFAEGVERKRKQKTIVKKLNALEPAKTLAEARKDGKAWLPLTRKGWTPEMHKKLEEMDDYEKRLAQVAEPFRKKFRDHKNFHSVWRMLHGRGWLDGVKFEAFEEQLKNSYLYDEGNVSFTEEELNSEEIKNLTKFVKENGVPGAVRRVKANEWASLYLNNAIETLDKENVPKDNPFRKWLQYDLNETKVHASGGIGAGVTGWVEQIFAGMEIRGKSVQHLADLMKGVTPKDANEVAKNFVANPNRRIGLNVNETTLEKILEDGRVLNLFENNGENAFVNPEDLRDPYARKERKKGQKEARLIAEQMIFGIPLVGQKKAAHPIYGFFHPDGVQNIGEWGDAYGNISLVMKRDVEARATMTAGDSIVGKFFGASPLNNPDGIGVRGGWNGTVNDEKPNFEGIGAVALNTYHEAQIFGGVKVSDIAYIAVPQDFEFKNSAMQARLVDLDISVVYIPNDRVLSEPQELRTKAEKMREGTLIAVSDNRKLYETENDKGYLMVGSKKIEVPSVASVLKFGYWTFDSDSEKKSMFDANQAVRDFYLVMSNAQEKSESPYTNNALRERIKARVMAGSEGGRPGQWSARKAQLVATRYRKAGGGYKKGKRPSKKQRSLKRWGKQKWRTSDGKPALRGGKMRRYLPDKVWGRLSPSQRAATNRKKIQGDASGRQFVANTSVAARKAKKVRNS